MAHSNVGHFFSFTQIGLWVNQWSYLAYSGLGVLRLFIKEKTMNTIVLVVAVLAILAVSLLAGFIVSWTKESTHIEVPSPIVVIPPRLSSDKDPGRILKRPLLQSQNSNLAAWLQGMKDCDKLFYQRKGRTVWGQPQMYRTAIHHPIMRWDLVKQTTKVTRSEMGAYYVRQAQY